MATLSLDNARYCEYFGRIVLRSPASQYQPDCAHHSSVARAALRFIGFQRSGEPKDIRGRLARHLINSGIQHFDVAHKKEFDFMFRRFLNRFKGNKFISPRDYEKDLALYRRQHPGSLEEEREQIQRWIGHVDARRRAGQQDSKENRSYAEEARLAEALYQLREIARAAFMSHPAATEFDFRRCWPSIREEMLKQHALEELAANPALSLTLATQASEAKAPRTATQDLHSPNLQLLKKAGDSD